MRGSAHYAGVLPSGRFQVVGRRWDRLITLIRHSADPKPAFSALTRANLAGEDRLASTRPVILWHPQSRSVKSQEPGSWVVGICKQNQDD
jgi:hypothetical protein